MALDLKPVAWGRTLAAAAIGLLSLVGVAALKAQPEAEPAATVRSTDLPAADVPATHVPATDGPPSVERQVPIVLREGTELVEILGEFKASGNRETFVTSEGAAYHCLENLNLERVMRIIGGNPNSASWLVSGVITEYQGTNYLLVNRAIRRTTAKSDR